MDKRIRILRTTATGLQQVSKIPIQGSASADSLKAVSGYYRAHTLLLESLSHACKELADKWERETKRTGAAKLSPALTKIFESQYVRLREKSQLQTRSFELVSNAMRARQDAARNLINNLR